MPALTQVAGFEWGSGFHINPVPPEEAAEFLRKVAARRPVHGNAPHERPGSVSVSGAFTGRTFDMDILFIASEVAPWSKTGGLGDVAGALPRALAARGHAVAVVTPRYYAVDVRQPGFEPLHRAVSVRGEPTTLWAAPGGRGGASTSSSTTATIGSRRGLYGDAHGDYGDNAERFAFLSRAALAAPAALGLRAAHRPPQRLADRRSSLTCSATSTREDPALARARTVFTIHNLAYQGLFPKHAVPALGLPWSVFRYDGDGVLRPALLHEGRAGLRRRPHHGVPTYAREILTPEDGAQLDAVLRQRAGDLAGILNGIDVAEWDPARDPHLPARYSAADLSGKAVCKAELQRELRLPVRPEVPLIGMVGRLAEQKGIDLVAAGLRAPRHAGRAARGAGERASAAWRARSCGPRGSTRSGWRPASGSTRGWRTGSRRARTCSSCRRGSSPAA